MSSGPSKNGTSSSETSKSNKPPQVVENSYIVTLQPKLDVKEYEAHFQTVYNLCRGFRVGNKAAGIERVYSEPIDSDKPTSVTYFALFPKQIADQISSGDRRNIIVDMHEERICNFSVAGTQATPSISWGPASISSPLDTFNTRYNNFKANNPPQTDQGREFPFDYNVLPTGGAGVTVYVIDTGCRITDHDVSQELQGREFINTITFNEKMEIEKSKYNSALPWNWLKNWKPERVQAAQNHPEEDVEIPFDNGRKGILHGTNAALCVGSSKRGTAPGARVVSIRSTSEKRAIDALQIILDRDAGGPVNKAVVNCSWSFPYDPNKDAMKSLKGKFTDLHNKGVAIVVAAGNDAKPLVKKQPTTTIAQSFDFSKNMPDCLDFAFLVGGYTLKSPAGANNTWTRQRNEASNYIHAGATVAEMPKQFYWAPGEHLPRYAPGGDPNNAPDNGYRYIYDLRGTSFAAPLFSGVLACLLAVQGQDPKKIGEALQNPNIVEQVTFDDCEPSRILRWQPN